MPIPRQLNIQVYMEHLGCVISYGNRRKMLILVPSKFHLIWAACHRQTGSFKPVMGLSPGYGAVPTSQTFPLILILFCVLPTPTGCRAGGLLCFVGDCNRGVQMTPGHCPKMFRTNLLQFPPEFNNLKSGMTWTDRLPIHPHSVPHSPSSSLCVFSSSTLEQHRPTHRMSHRRFSMNSCLSLDKVASQSLCCCSLFVSSSFFQTTLCPALPLCLSYVFSKHMPRCSPIHMYCITWTPVLCYSPCLCILKDNKKSSETGGKRRVGKKFIIRELFTSSLPSYV